MPIASERLDPPLIDVVVEDGYRRGDVNLPEARFIVDEIKAIASDPNGAYLSPLWDGLRFRVLRRIHAPFCHTGQFRQQCRLAQLTQPTESRFDSAIRLDCLPEGGRLLAG